ncbi:MAG: ATPase domain-containing protein, partial [Verrucomicrobiota bacterium]
FSELGTAAEVKAMVTRVIDFFKLQQITALFTSLTSGGSFMEATEVGVSSLMDSWLLLRDIESGAERNRVLHLLKSRGMAHSNQVREFVLTGHGVELRDVYVGPSGTLLTGSARLALEAQEKAEAVAREQKTAGRKRDLERKRQGVEAQIAALRSGYETDRAELEQLIAQDKSYASGITAERAEMARQRQADAPATRKTKKRN